jgi:hypothetical protein
VGEKTFKDFSRAGSDAGFKLDDLNAQYHQIGTVRQQALSKAFAEIAYPDALAGYDNGDVVTIHGQNYTRTDLLKLTQDEREALADAWITQHGGSEELDAYNTERKAFVTANPEFGSFKEWEHTAYGYDGGLHAFRMNRAAGNPNFKAAMDRQREYLKSTGVDASVLESELDQWAAGIDAYKASQGIRNSVYDPNAVGTGDQATVDMLAQATGGGGAAEKKTPIEKTRDSVQKYVEKIDAIVAQLNAAGFDVTAQDVVFAKPMYRKVFALYDVPPLSEEANLYEQWVLMQPAGTDTSVDAWITYLESLPSYKAAA